MPNKPGYGAITEVAAMIDILVRLASGLALTLFILYLLYGLFAPLVEAFTRLNTS